MVLVLVLLVSGFEIGDGVASVCKTESAGRKRSKVGTLTHPY